MQMIDYKGDRLSHLSLGTVQLGLDYGIANKDGKPTTEKACEIISTVTQRGINCFDTAIDYGDSERVLGECLKKEAFIISKISSNELENIEKEAKSSLGRLNQKELWGILLHDSKILDHWSNKESQRIAILKDKGLIKHFGVSIYSKDEFDKALEIEDIELIQVPSNMLDNRLVKNSWISRAKQKGKLLFIRSIYLQGIFFLGSKALPPYLEDAKEPLKELESIANSLNINLSQLALSYIKTIAKDAIILFGAENRQQAIENIELFNESLNLDLEIIDKIILIASRIDENIYNPSLWRR